MYVPWSDIAYKFCWNRPLLLFEEKIQILSVSLQVLLKQAFTAVFTVFEEMMQILSASFEKVFKAVGRENTDFICWLLSSLKAGLWCCLKSKPLLPAEDIFASFHHDIRNCPVLNLVSPCIF